jgi:3-hydroxybutyryl-CoA dehydrogenase
VSQPKASEGGKSATGGLTERLGIVGSGTVAARLAKLAGPLGDVVLWARSEESAERARSVSGESGEIATDLERLAASTFVVEAVAEDHAVKCGLYEQLDGMIGDDAVLATTTSSLSVEELAAASGRPDRFACVHFFNPVDKMELVELVFPAEASEETRARTRALCESLGKTAVELPDTPGFVVNRLLFPYLFEAVRLLERNGVEPEAIDTCMRLGAGHPMGPLALLDYVGLDVAIAIGEQIGAEIPDRVRELVAEGKLGKKAGEGFYTY